MKDKSVKTVRKLSKYNEKYTKKSIEGMVNCLRLFSISCYKQLLHSVLKPSMWTIKWVKVFLF